MGRLTTTVDADGQFSGVTLNALYWPARHEETILTTAIYKSWFGLFNLPGAAQLASLLVMLVFVLRVQSLL